VLKGSVARMLLSFAVDIDERIRNWGS